MHYHRISPWFALTILLLGLSLAAPALVVRMPLEEMVGQADLILSVRVQAMESRWVEEGDGRNIYTTVTLVPGRLLKGHAPGETLLLTLLGGEVGEWRQVVTDLATFEVGEEAVLFLKGPRRVVMGGFQGKFPIEAGSVRVEGVEVPVERFMDAVEAFRRDPGADLYGTLLGLGPVVESGGAISPLDASRIEKPADAAAPPGRALTSNLVLANWDYEVDYDGDGYIQFGRLLWDADVKGGSGSITVFDKVYWRLAGTTAWSHLYTTPLYVITNYDSTDARILNLYGSARQEYDFRIESYREGQAAPDDFMDPSNKEWALIAKKMEPPAEDQPGTGPMIVEMHPEKASAGTGTEAYIRGVGFGTKGTSSRVQFTFEGQSTITGSTISEWNDNVIRVQVPIGRVAGYPGSAATGPVWVTNSAGAKSPGYDYKVSFGYGGMKWNGAPPTISYYLGSNIPDWTATVAASTGTWGQHGNIVFTQAGTTENRDLRNNGKSEIMASDLGPGYENTLGYATYWSNAQGYMVEADLVLNTKFNYSIAETTPSGAFDVHSIVLHETGHWLTLRDLYGDGDDRDKVMYGYAGSGPSSNKRTPHPDDAAGVAWIYGFNAPPVADFAWFAGRPEIGTGLQFVDASSLVPTAWSWDFGDGTTSMEQNPVHTYLFSGTFPVTLTVSNAFGTSSATKQVIVYGRGIVPPLTTAQPYTYLLPAAAKAQGANNTNWLSDVVVHNPRSAEISVYAYFLPSGQDNAAAAGSEVILPGFRFVRLGDIVGSMFRLNNLAGALWLTSTQPLAITSRTYNDRGVLGTYGQFIPATLSSRLLKSGEEGILLHLAKNAGFRTNVGVVNAGSGFVEVKFSFHRADGSHIGDWSRTLNPFEHYQQNYVMDALTSAAVDDAYAVVTSSTPGAVFAAYASVADNISSDPIFIPIQRAGDVQGQAHQVVAAAARTQGGYGSNWRTDLRLYNPFASQAVTLTYVAAGATATANLTIGQGELVSRDDILTTLFPSVTGNTSGALHLQSSQGLIVTSRTYTSTAGLGTFGQFIPARGAAADLIAPGETGLLLQLANTADYRSNVGFTEVSGQGAQVQVKLYDANRSVLGFKTYPVPAHGNFQVNIFSDLGIAAPHAVALGEVSVLSGGSVYAYASVVDNRTTSNDAFFIPAQK